MIHEGARNSFTHMRRSNKFKYTDGKRSFSALVTKTHDFVEFFRTNDLFRYTCIENKLKHYQIASGKLLF